jgi:hypothetical protein
MGHNLTVREVHGRTITVDVETGKPAFFGIVVRESESAPCRLKVQPVIGPIRVAGGLELHAASVGPAFRLEMN